MKTIGILGGLGPESTILYYSWITRRYFEARGDYAYPNVVINSLSFQEVIDAGYQTSGIVRTGIEGLHRAGADFVVAACNSIHVVYDEVAKQSPIPWLSIMDAVAERLKAADITRVGLMGTRVTMQGDFYQTALARQGIEVMTPSNEAQEGINRIIFDELVRAVVKPESRRFLLGCVDDLKSGGAQGIILGCTELPFAVEQKDTAVPIFDSATIHAQKALDLAMTNSD